MAAISSVSGSDALPGGDYNLGTYMTKEGGEDTEEQRGIMIWVDENFYKTYEMELLAGRFHNKDLRGEENQVVINETLLERFGLGTPEEAVGKKMQIGDGVYPIIGVLKDYHWFSLKNENESVLLNYTEYGSNISLRLQTNDIQNTIASIRDKYQVAFPNNPFDFHFMDDFFDRQYKEDQQYGQIFTSFSIVAVIIACLGLFGLASFTLSLRTKEIGVRKVLGASLSSILMIIYKDYLILILIASVVALPLVYWAIEVWLDNYAYHIEITWDILVLPVFLLALVAWMSISQQSFRAATADPIKNLRTE